MEIVSVFFSSSVHFLISHLSFINLEKLSGNKDVM